MQLFPRSIEKYLSKVKGPVIIYVEVAGGGEGGGGKNILERSKIL